MARRYNQLGVREMSYRTEVLAVGSVTAGGYYLSGPDNDPPQDRCDCGGELFECPKCGDVLCEECDDEHQNLCGL